MKLSTIFILIALAVTTPSFGETEKQHKAREFGMKAIKEMDARNIKEAIVMLEQSKKLDPDNIIYPYEIAYAYFLNKNYKKSIEILNELIGHPKTTAKNYQLLGTAYDMDGDSEKAIKTYDEGLDKFPKSGLLYLERGNMEVAAKNYEIALSYYEKGIQADPQFPSNYYWASKIYLNSTEKVWGMIYGEVFMNLERNSRRTAEINKLLFDTYKSQIQFKSDGSFSVDFTRITQIPVSSTNKIEKAKLPFELSIYEPTLASSIAGEKNTSLSTLNRIRDKFLTTYYRKELYKEYPNVLFEYQRKVKDAGHLKAYNHWILMKGDEKAFKQWYEKEGEKFESFVKWFADNPIELNSKSKVYRGQYKNYCQPVAAGNG